MKRTFMDDLDDFVFGIVGIVGAVFSIIVVGAILGILYSFMLPWLIKEKIKKS